MKKMVITWFPTNRTTEKEKQQVANVDQEDEMNYFSELTVNKFQIWETLSLEKMLRNEKIIYMYMKGWMKSDIKIATIMENIWQ